MQEATPIIPKKGGTIFGNGGITGNSSGTTIKNSGPIFNKGVLDALVQWKDPNQVATGWDKYRDVFSGGDDILYAVIRDNMLMWFKYGS